MSDPKNRPRLRKPLLLSVSDLVELLQVSPASVWTWRDSGILPPPLRVGRRVMWRREDIERWVEEGCPKRRPHGQKGDRR